jgi:hypothetical protein
MSGSSSVLPVSLIVLLPDEEDGGVEDDDVGGLELPQAARTAASGMSTAAASGRGILLVTEDYSLGLAHAWGAR